MTSIIQEIKKYTFIKKRNGVLQHVNDGNKYHVHILPNGLQILFIQNKKSNISGAHMYVDVGSFENPIHLPGLAHFLEHMLFMGSDLYPGESYFQSEIANNGGMTNAFTSNDSTQYYFSVNNNFLKILKIFSRFFIRPLFDVGWVSKEVNAVNSEHDKNKNSPMWMIYSISKLLFKNKIHSGFATGTKETLLGSCDNDPEKLREQLLNFYHTYYSSHKMVLFISHNNITDEFIKNICDMFSSVPLNKNDQIIRTNAQYDIYDTMYELIKIKIPSNEKKLILNWLIDCTSYQYDKLSESCLNILCYILGNHKKNSIFDILITNGYIYDAMCEVEQTFVSNSIFVMTFNMTELGYVKWKTIVYIVSHYIYNLLLSDTYLNIYINEFDNLSILSFKTADSLYGYELLERCAAIYTTRKINLKYILITPILNDRTQQFIKCKKALQSMQLNKMKVLLASNSFSDMDVPHIDKWYQARYGKSQIPINNNMHGVTAFEYPMTNIYMPSLHTVNQLQILNLKNNKDKTYHKINLSNNTLCYWKSNNDTMTYNIYGKIYIELDSMIDANIDVFIMITLYIGYIKKVKNNEIFMLSTCGIDIDLILDIFNQIFTISGISYDINKFFNMVFDWYFGDVVIDYNTYTLVYDEMMVRYINNQQIEAYKMINKQFKKMLNTKYTFTYKEMIESLKKISPDKIKTQPHFIKNIQKLMSSGKIVCVFAGSVSQEVVQNIMTSVKNKITSVKSIKKCIKYKLDKTQFFQDSVIQNLNTSEKENAIGYGIYIGTISIDNLDNWLKIMLYCMIINLIIPDKFTTNVRTNQQVGYVAQCNIINITELNNRDYFLLFTVQSTRNDLYNIMNQYVDNNLMNDILSVTDDEYDMIIKSIIVQLNEKYNNIVDDVENAFNVILSTHKKYNDRETFSMNKILYNYIITHDFSKHVFFSFMDKVIKNNPRASVLIKSS